MASSVSFRASIRAALSQAPAVPAQPFVEELAAEMARRWRQGEKPTTEEFLDRHPALRQQPEAAFHLICEELCLREEAGETVDAAAVLRRFPQWQAQLEVVLACRQLFQPAAPPGFPNVGKSFGAYRLLAELGRGAAGRVYLAAQPALADRTVVVKLTPCDGQEHLTLARLQHTSIVPLYTVEDDPARNLRVLCMPYFGGASLGRLLELLKCKPVAQRSGRDLLAALEEVEASRPVAAPAQGVARKLYERASYVQAACWIGAALADALHYAHARGLAHFDIKPSNVLIAADGQPMLLDFHLARQPLAAAEADIDWLGGTPDYMSPEQRAAVDAVSNGRPVPSAVDGRSDVYALGLVLYEALGGPLRDRSAAELRRWNPAVSVGLADILGKCLAAAPKDRYADAAALAADLRNHLSDRPLVGVRNRSLKERWRKWRRQQPHGLRRWVWATAAVVALAAAGATYWHRVEQRRSEAALALSEGREQLERGELVGGVHTLRHGRELARQFPADPGLAAALEAELHRARRLELTGQLQRIAEQARFLAGSDELSPAAAARVADACRSVWASRSEIWSPATAESAADTSQRIRMDLLDVAVLLADLSVRAAAPADKAQHQRAALEVLAQAEALLGNNVALCLERQTHATALGLTDMAQAAAAQAAALGAQTAWEHDALGRALLRAGKLAEAAQAFERAVRLQPDVFWPHFYQGACAYRGKHFAEAVNAFDVCIALAPRKAECYFNRALAYHALGDLKRATEDYSDALRLSPGMSAAALNRGLIRFEEKRYEPAIADLNQALTLGADAAVAHYNLAVIYHAQNDRRRALAHVEQALQVNPQHRAARELRERLKK
jgi:serine/threonine protein kinase/lipoprotein NlpI